MSMTTKPIITEEKIDVVIGDLRRKLIENMPCFNEQCIANGERTKIVTPYIEFNDGRYVYVEL